MITLAGGTGVSFLTINDARRFVDTPLDTAEKIDFGNLGKQCTMIACLTDHWFRDARDDSARPKPPSAPRSGDEGSFHRENAKERKHEEGNNRETRGKRDQDSRIVLHRHTFAFSQFRAFAIISLPPPRKSEGVTYLGISHDCNFTRMAMQGGFARLSGSVVEYDPQRSFVPNTKVRDALVVVRSVNKSLMGVRANIVDWAGNGFSIPGVAPVTAYDHPHRTSIGAYKLDDRTGEITCAPDQGSYGENYPVEFPIRSAFKEMPIVVFDCKATSVYDLFDPLSLTALDSISVYDGDTNGAPWQVRRGRCGPRAGEPSGGGRGGDLHPGHPPVGIAGGRIDKAPQARQVEDRDALRPFRGQAPASERERREAGGRRLRRDRRRHARRDRIQSSSRYVDTR